MEYLNLKQTDKPNRELRKKMVNENKCPYCFGKLKKYPTSEKTQFKAMRRKKAFYKFTRRCTPCKKQFFSLEDKDKTFYERKEKTRKTRYLVKGIGNPCSNCGETMERRTHNTLPSKTWYYTEWDVCRNYNCKKTVQHYDQFKSPDWQEAGRQEEHLKHI